MTAAAPRDHRKAVLILLAILAAMVVLVALSPRLYRAFCQATGYDGTTQRAERAPGAVPGQVTVRFDSNVQPGLPWKFEPVQNIVSIAPGAKTQIFYRAKNLSTRAWTGQAVYNVSPDTVGKYFKKIQCFCFTEQTLQPGQDVKMPVIFFVDPELRKDPDTKDVHEITLSYTFYPVETGATAR